MIFKQIDEIVNGTKTQTRRACKPNELGDLMLLARDSYSAVHSTHDNGSRLRLKWCVGNDYAVQPGRGKPGVWFMTDHPRYGIDIWYTITSEDHKIARGQGYQPLRIVITAIRREPLQAITEADAIAEGVGTRKWDASQAAVTLRMGYRDRWESINGAGSWDADPDVWCISFEIKQ